METCSDAACALRLDQLPIPRFLARLNENSRREGKNCGMVGLLRPKLVSAGQSGCIFYGVDRVLSVELRFPSRLTRIIGGVIDAVTNIPTTSELTAARGLRAVMRGSVALQGDYDYVQTRRIWNGAVQHQPALFARCETPADVQAGVRSAREHGFPLSVRGGGHDWAGRALCHQGFVIDLSPMKRVDVSLDASVATIQGGLLAPCCRNKVDSTDPGVGDGG